MLMDADIITILNQILEDLYDSRNGYKEGAEQVNHEVLKNYFNRLVVSRQNMIDSIEQEVTALNGRVTTEGSLLAGVHRIFLDFKSLITKGDSKAIADEVKRGEHLLIDNYQRTLSRSDLPERIKKLLEKQLSEIEANLKEIDDITQS